MGKNEVSLTFVGDTVSLERANERAQASLAATGKAYDKTADHAVAASKRMESVAEATDHIDTLGSKATSSLGALSSGFELLGPSGQGAAQGLMTLSLATDALSGAGEAATIATETLRGAVNKAKTAFQALSVAGKASVVALGAVGIIAAAVATAWALSTKRTNEVKEATQSYIDTLDQLSGATTDATRAQVYKNLVEKDAVRSAERLGISSKTLVDAILSEGDARATVTDRLKRYNEQLEKTQGATADEDSHRIAEALGIESQALEESRRQLVDQANAVHGSTTATEGQQQATEDATKALKDYSRAIQDQFDPMANLVHRLEDVRDKQKDYSDAVKEHGRKSREAKDANLELASSILAASGAAVDAQGRFDGKLTPALRNILKQGGFTEVQIREIEAAFKDAKKAGDAYSKTYRATAILEEFAQYRSGERSPQGRASGGPTMAGRVYKVGEAGPELLAMGSPGYVANARETMSILSGGGGGTKVIAPVVEFRSNGTSFEDMLVTEFNKAVRTGRITTVVRA